MSLAIPALAGADLVNTASVSYRDLAGVPRTGISNTVTVIVDVISDTPPDPDLSGLDGKTYKVHDTIVLPYLGNATGFNWEFVSADNPSGVGAGFQASADSSLFSVPTLVPQLPLSSLSLTTGRYSLRVQAVKGSLQSSWSKRVTVTFFSEDLSAVKVYPNPFRAARGDTVVHFEGLTAGSTVKIFTISGRRVQTLDETGDSALWNLKNDAGEPVASGLYLFLITDSRGNKTRGKLALIR